MPASESHVANTQLRWPSPLTSHHLTTHHPQTNEDWGMDGYVYIKYGEDLCSITYLPTYVDTEIVEP